MLKFPQRDSIGIAFSSLLWLSCQLWSASAAAQDRYVTELPASKIPSSSTLNFDLKDRLNLEHSKASLGASNPEYTFAAAARLASTPQGIAKLIEQLEAEEPSSAELRLFIVRKLARYSKQPKVRGALLRVVLEAPKIDLQSFKARLALDELTRAIAALALARSGDPKALSSFASFVYQDSKSGHAIRNALLAYPPQDTSSFLYTGNAASSAYIKFLGELGDQRAFHVLRALVRRGSIEQRAEAALALTELGAFETVPLAELWLKQHAEHPALARSAAWILTMARAPTYPAAIQQLIELGHWEEATRLAQLAGHPQLVSILAEAFAKAPEALHPGLLMAIGASGGEQATKFLAARWGAAEYRADISLALARARDEASLAELKRGLSEPKTQALALRALALRGALTGEEHVSRSQLDEALQSKDVNIRAAAAFALAALHDEAAIQLIQHPDPVLTRAAMRTALGRDSLLQAAAERLATEKDQAVISALSLALSSQAAAARVPTAQLRRLVHESPAGRYLAAFALSLRLDKELEPELNSWLSSGDPKLRASVALGLGGARRPRVLSMLERAYRFEVDPEVRLAIAAAIAERPEPSRRLFLTQDAPLDPDPRVRQVALQALGSKQTLQAAGGGVGWFSAPTPETGALYALAPFPPIPFIPDDDGHCPTIGLPEGDYELRAVSAR